jgi:uncharacterized protein
MKKTANAASLSAEQVLGYLAAHPDFCDRYPDALTYLRPKNEQRERAGVADFQAFQVRALQQQLRELKSVQQELLKNAEGNLDILDAIHRCVLLTLQCRSLEEIWTCVTTRWREQLGVSVATLAVEKPKGRAVPLPFSALPVVPLGTFGRLFPHGFRARRDLDVLLSAETSSTRFLYGAGAAEVQSDVVIAYRVGEGYPVLLMAFGSKEAGQFHPEQSTDLIQFLGNTFAEVLRWWLDAPNVKQ